MPDRVQALSRVPTGNFDATKHNVLVVVVDDIGPEWFEWMGIGLKYTTDPAFEYVRTPFLSDCADNGLWFSNFSAEPVCSETRVSINAGWYAHRTGWGFNIRDPGSALGTDYPSFGLAAPSSITYLAEYLRSRDPTIETGAFGKWHMADGYDHVVSNIAVDPPNVNLSHYAALGYQTWKGNIYNVGGGYSWWKLSNGSVSGYLTGAFDETTYPSSVHAADAASWLAARTGQFFCYVAFGPPHSDWTVPPDTMLSDETNSEMGAAGLTAGDAVTGGYSDANFPLVFRSGMEATDEAIRRLWMSIPSGQRAKTLLIVTGDNGTVSNALVPGFSHFKRQVFAGGTSVPFLMRGPMVARPGRESRQVGHIVDIFKTVCDVMGQPVSSPTIARDSVSLLPVLHDLVDRTDVNALRSHIFTQTFRPVSITDPAQWIAASRQRAVYDGKWRMLFVPTGKFLYNDDLDYLETTDLKGTNDEVENRLAGYISAELPQ